MPLNIFLTGGTGLIGRHVLDAATTRGHKVSALSRSAAAADTMAALGATPVMGNLTAPEDWIAQAAAADVFIHLASTFDDTMAQSEPALLACLDAHTAARATPLRVIYTGGCWLFGATRSAVAHENTPLRPIAAFDWAAQAIAALGRMPQLSTAVIHPAMVYSQTGGVFRRMMTALNAGRPAPVWGDVQTRWPLVHARDLAQAYLILAQRPEATGTFNVVTERGVAVGDIAAVLSAQAGIKARPATLPRTWVLARHGPWAEGPMLDQQMRSTRMEALGWAAEHADFSHCGFQF